MTDSTATPNRAMVRKVVGDVAPLNARTVELYAGLFAAVPDDDGEGASRILEAIANAESPADLDAPWRSGDIAELHDVELVVLDIRKMASDYDGGLPFYLVADCAFVETGEKIAVVSGALDVMAQLVKAYVSGWLPMTVIPRVATRPTARGYYPQHLEIVRTRTTGRAG